MSPPFSPKRAVMSYGLLSSLLILGPLSLTLSAQDFSRNLATADQFFLNGILPEDLAVLVDPTLDGALKGVVGYNLSAGVRYDSNVNLSSTNEEGDFFFNINPSIFYKSDPEGGARHTISAYYSPNPTFFRSESATGGSSNRFNHNGGLSYRFQGSRTMISVFMNLAQASGSDRFTGGYSEGTVLSTGLRASYQIAPRTTINGSLSSSYLGFNTAGQQNSDYVSLNFGASWAATERLSFGPSIGGTWSDSDNTGSITTVNVSFRGSYIVTELINLNASIGVRGISYGGNGNDRDPSLTGSLGFSYRFSPIWSWRGSISNAYIPSPADFGYAVNDWSFSTSLSRSLDVGSISVNASYSISTYDSVGFAVPGTGPQDRNYYQLGISYSRPFFSERISFSTRLSYLGSTGNNDWTKWVASCSWGTSF